MTTFVGFNADDWIRGEDGVVRNRHAPWQIWGSIPKPTLPPQYNPDEWEIIDTVFGGLIQRKMKPEQPVATPTARPLPTRALRHRCLSIGLIVGMPH